MNDKRIACLFVLLGFAATCGAFNGHMVSEGPLKITIGDIQIPGEYDKPVAVPVTVQNQGDVTCRVRLRLVGLVDEWYAVGPAEIPLELPAGQTQNAEFRIAAGRGAFSALYPVHVYADFSDRTGDRTAHAVQIFASDFGQAASSADQAGGELPVLIVPAGGALSLTGPKGYRVAWCYFDKPWQVMGVGWQGSDSLSAANFNRQNITRGDTRYSLQMHPPWRGGAGTMYAEYHLRLPETGPVRLTFANAIRDHSASEPPSDGVTFRVWVLDGQRQEAIFERHTDSKTWLAGQADLSRFAGREIFLRLECHPGPRRDTTCDSAYWAEPTVTAGEPPPQLTPTQRENLRQRARQLIANNQSPAVTGDFISDDVTGKECFFPLDDGYTAVLIMGPNGLADSTLALGTGNKTVVFDGLNISIMNQKVGGGSSLITIQKIHTEKMESYHGIKITYRLRMSGEEFDLDVFISKYLTGLHLMLQCPKRITDFSLAPADQKAPRVYYGHGYCIEEPQVFRAGFGGHNLSTSHVGFDFEKGISLLMATTNTPDYLAVNPNEQIYTLHTHMDGRMTLVPSVKGAFDCAVRYRPLYDKQAAPDFTRKAGRFVFDIWGGRYAENAAIIKRMIAYGLTDTMVTLHVWQRWGYDYRLPDIYPPNPELGTLEDLLALGAVCDAQDIPWGLHDNYIDFYPDAADYSYDHICFTAEGEPVKAWYNQGRKAQSYRWRPDHIMPFVQRNLKLIKPDLDPSHYFIDVFTSIDIFDYYDREGRYHSFLETRWRWGEAFAWIRDYLGDNAVMTSEAGHDQLTGYLAGADCQHLRITERGGSFCLAVPCGDWQRVCWFDAVLHDRFSLHGVGYSGRYQGGRDRLGHGIISDDYLSDEILTGHALMTDRAALVEHGGRDAVRKYYLAQDFIRSIAADTIREVRFVGDDIHRQRIAWSSGAVVQVNRGGDDWQLADRVLPPCGYYARNGPLESSIERRSGLIVEQARGPGRWYVNARGYHPDAALQVRPSAQEVEYLGGNRFRLLIDWQLGQTIPKDLPVFVHFTSERSDRPDRIAFQGDFRPSPPTSRWQGERVTTGSERTYQVDPDYPADDYEIKVGFWDPADGRRYRLLGDDDGGRAYRLGRLIVRKSGREITGIELERYPETPLPPPRWNPRAEPVDFGAVKTSGACRVLVQGDSIWVHPLPQLEPFAVTLRLDVIRPGDRRAIQSVTAVDAAGESIRRLDFEQANRQITFTTAADEFAYRLQ
ncbi:MAG: hypothetical protein JW810_09280 [Sedimentisphaerales bacterium]|nr:hypothetical protein [Sedimentisphaerales bacterium]